jgi:hypothetical protein
MALQPFCWALAAFTSFLIIYTVGRTLAWGISPLQGLYLHTELTHTIQTSYLHYIYIIDTHALSGIRTHDPSDQASKDGSCLRPQSHCDQPFILLQIRKNCVIRRRSLLSYQFTRRAIKLTVVMIE